jgi:short-subunit dehydrogenase
MKKIPKTICITGASSGLGTALALSYAHSGVTLFLTGRHSTRLASVADACRNQGATVHTSAVDVTKKGLMQAWAADVLGHGTPDLIIANAGISGGTAEGSESLEQMESMVFTNILGVFYTIEPFLPALKAKRSGQIAIISSLAGYRGFPGAPAYCATKAAVKSYGESLRGLLGAEGIAVTTVCPGYIQTQMTEANDFHMPLMWPAKKAAAVIKHALTKNPARLSFPWPMTFLVWLLMVLPARWVDGLLRRLPRKQALPTDA